MWVCLYQMGMGVCVSMCVRACVDVGGWVCICGCNYYSRDIDTMYINIVIKVLYWFMPYNLLGVGFLFVCCCICFFTLLISILLSLSFIHLINSLSPSLFRIQNHKLYF